MIGPKKIDVRYGWPITPVNTSACRKEGDGIINSLPIMQVVRDISSNTIVELKAILQEGSIGWLAAMYYKTLGEIRGKIEGLFKGI